MSFPKVRRTLLRDEAYRLIRDAIVDGSLAPGTVIRDADLATSLGLSRAPIREALARLGTEGLVESKPQSFTRVTALDMRDVRDAGAVVRAMHDLAVREAVPRIGATDLVTMRAANTRFAAAVRTADVDAALVADDELHDVLVHACANRAVIATIERYSPLIRRLERLRFASLSGRRSIRLHDQLITACAAGDVEAAAAVNHEIWSTLDELLDAEPTPDPGE